MNNHQSWGSGFSYFLFNYLTLDTANFHKSLAFVFTYFATFFASYFNYPLETFFSILVTALVPNYFVFDPSHKAFSFVYSNISSGLMSTKGMSSLTIF
jgi:hypothetical protein